MEAGTARIQTIEQLPYKTDPKSFDWHKQQFRLDDVLYATTIYWRVKKDLEQKSIECYVHISYNGKELSIQVPPPQRLEPMIKWLTQVPEEFESEFERTLENVVHDYHYNHYSRDPNTP